MGNITTHYKCLEWHDMLDFPQIPKFPKYFLAKYCKICEVWFPRDSIGKRCPCCHENLRSKPRTYSLSKDMIVVWQQQLDDYKLAHPDWTLIKPKVVKAIMDLAIIKGNV